MWRVYLIGAVDGNMVSYFVSYTVAFGDLKHLVCCVVVRSGSGVRVLMGLVGGVRGGSCGVYIQ